MRERIAVGVLAFLAGAAILEGAPHRAAVSLTVLVATVAATAWVHRRVGAPGLVERVLRRAALASVLVVVATTVAAAIAS